VRELKLYCFANHHGSIDKIQRRMLATTVSSEGLHSATHASGVHFTNTNAAMQNCPCVCAALIV
jgi:hypothetical protein